MYSVTKPHRRASHINRLLSRSFGGSVACLPGLHRPASRTILISFSFSFSTPGGRLLRSHSSASCHFFAQDLPFREPEISAASVVSARCPNQDSLFMVYELTRKGRLSITSTMEVTCTACMPTARAPSTFSIISSKNNIREGSTPICFEM